MCAALGGSSAYTWLKIQATADIATVAAMTTQPLLLLGGAPGPDPEATFAAWERALAEPTVRGLVVGRALLYPPDGDVEAAVGAAAELVERAATAGQPSERAPVARARPAAPPPATPPSSSTPTAPAGRTAGCSVRTLDRGRRHVHHRRHRDGRAAAVRARLTVEVEGRRFDLAGRESVFAAVTDWAYLPDRRRGAPVRAPARRGRPAVGRRHPALRPASRRRRRRAGRGARRRPGDPPGHQLHGARRRSTAPTS